MAAVTICSDLEPRKIKSVTVSIDSPSICHEVLGLGGMIIFGEQWWGINSYSPLAWKYCTTYAGAVGKQ